MARDSASRTLACEHGKHSAGYVIQGAKNSFGIAVLWRGVWVQETEVNPREEDRAVRVL